MAITSVGVDICDIQRLGDLEKNQGMTATFYILLKTPETFSGNQNIIQKTILPASNYS